MTPRKNFGISRIDQPEKKSHGWYVRVSKNAAMFFADGKHGSRTKSREGAEAYRNSCFNGLTYPQKERASKPRNAGRKRKAD